MAKTEMIRARVEPDLKHDAEAVFSTLGMSPTEAITLFYKQVTLQHGLPFEIRIPNAETLEAMRQVRENDGLIKYNSLDDLMTEFDNA
jgi:DNA-damage-inducible protein J